MEQKLKTSIPEFLIGGGEMGERIREYDWNKTSLGHPETWDNSLKTCVRIILTSPQPMFVWWGRDFINVYNDAYAQFMNKKHPAGLGQKASEVWSEIWQDLVPRIESVYRNEGTYDDSLLLIMERKGYQEEMYVSFCYSPIPGDDGTVKGLFCACAETTDRIINERALATLRDIGNVAFEEKSVDVIYIKVAEALEKNNKDFPFALVRKITDDGIAETASKTSNLEVDKQLLPNRIDTNNPSDDTKEFCEVYRTNKISVRHIGNGTTLPRGFWNTSPTKLVHIPVSGSGKNHPYAIITAALNPYRKFDESFRQFCQAIGDSVSLEINNMLALEEESKRAKALAQIDKAKTLFFSNVSHEFRTPLTLMLGSLEEMLKNPTRDEQDRQAVETTHRNALRLLRLVNNLLDFSRIEAGKTKARFQKTDIAKYTADVASNFRSIIENVGLTFKIKTQRSPEPVYIDREMWEKIVLNLLSNAFKYTLQGTIELSLIPENNLVVLKVRDSGVGIPEEELPKMFERFHRVQNVTGRTYEGTGIGLSLVKELVNLHGGEISVRSKVGEGTEFAVRIPTGKLHFPKDNVVENEVEFNSDLSNAFLQELTSLVEQPDLSNGTLHSHSAENSATILIVDDNADMRIHIKNLLHKNYSVISAANGLEALEKIKENKPLLVISDIMMPVMDGIQMVKEIKGNPSTASLPVILLSARAGEEAKIEGYEIGADDYLVKPFSAKELLARVRSQIELVRKRDRALQNLYQLFDEVPFAVALLMGDSLRIEFINRHNLEIWQRRKEDVFGRALFDVFPGNRAEAEQIHRKIYETGERFTANELPIELWTNGELKTRYFNTVIDPVRNEEGQILGQLSTTIEVTEQVLLRENVEKSEKYFHSLTDTVPAIIWITDTEGYCTYLNKHWYEYTGQTKNEAEGFGWLNATHPDDKERSGKIFLDANTAQKPFSILYRLRSRSGAYRWAIDSGSPKIGADGQFEGMIGTVIDIHEQKLAEETLRKTSVHLEIATTSANVGTWTLYLPEGTLDWSPLHKKLWGYDDSRTDLVYEDWHKVILAEDKEAAFAEVEAARKSRSQYEAVYRIQRPNDGVIRWMRSLGQYFYDEQGNPFMLSGVSIDITEQKEAEAALRSSENRYKKLSETLEEQVSDRTNKLQRSNEDLQQFAHVASHDLKEPVRKIKTFLSRLQNEYGDSLPAKGKEFVFKMNSATSRIYNMIEGVLQYSSADSLDGSAQDVSLQKIIEDIIIDAEITIEEKGAKFEYGDLPNLNGIPVLLYQLFYNLINNSLKFSKHDVSPVIKISSQYLTKQEVASAGLPPSQQYVKITLEDNGIGFEQSHADDIFKTFKRLNSKDKFEGTGLGLALCKKIVDRHGGLISAASSPNEGAKFSVVLPRASMHIV